MVAGQIAKSYEVEALGVRLGWSELIKITRTILRMVLEP